MSLIKCSECGKEFSDKASACPNCACPIQSSEKNSNIKTYDFLKKLNKRKLSIILGIILTILLFCIVITKILNSKIDIAGTWKYSNYLISGDTFVEKYTFDKNGHATYIRQVGKVKREFECKYKFRNNNTQIKISCNYDTEEIKKKNNIWVNFEMNGDKIYIDNKAYKSY